MGLLKILFHWKQTNNNNNGSNLNFSIGEGQTGDGSATKTEEEVIVKKRLIVRLYERFPRLKKREDYALFILSPENPYDLFFNV